MSSRLLEESTTASPEQRMASSTAGAEMMKDSLVLAIHSESTERSRRPKRWNVLQRKRKKSKKKLRKNWLNLLNL